MAPLAAVSGTRVNLISPNVGGGRSSMDTFVSVDFALRRTYWFVLNAETNSGLIKYSRMPGVRSAQINRLEQTYSRTEERDAGDSAA